MEDNIAVRASSTRVAATSKARFPMHRQPSSPKADLPAGTILVSADNHWFVEEDIFYARAPRHVRERMPRIWWDEHIDGWNIGVEFKPSLLPDAKGIVTSIGIPGSGKMDVRMAHNDANGVAMEVSFPQWLLFFLHHPDLEAREWMFRLYNEYLAEVQQRAPGRFFGVGIANFWDASKMRASLEHMKDIGLKTFMIPRNPGKDASGRQLAYATDEMEPLWCAAEEVGLPVCFHVGEDFFPDGARGSLGAGLLASLNPFRKTLGELIFGGILDRHPGVRIVFAESGINWIPGALQDAEITLDSFRNLLDYTPALRPTDYWTRNCFATFMCDHVGLENLKYIGADRVMWAMDYPHLEGCYGYTQEAIEDVLRTANEEEARMILGGTAIRLFDLA